MTREVTPQNAQVIEAAVNGPDGATRLYICTGLVTAFFQAADGDNPQETFVFSVGPALTRRQIIRASATAAPANYYVRGTATDVARVGIVSADADWNDEANAVEVRIEAAGQAPSGVLVAFDRFMYHVTILAEV
jgi:hypothetical protein